MSTSRESGDVCNGPVKRVFTVDDMVKWKNTTAYADYYGFIKQLNEFGKGTHDGLHDVSQIKMDVLVKVVKLLNKIADDVDRIKPFDGDNQRFGNKAYRVWYDEMSASLIEFFTENSELNTIELKPYLEESFGNRQRIDYGTGHEMNFMLFLMGIYKLHFYTPGQDSKYIKQFSHELLTLFGFVYLPLCRKIQLMYQLEPAGSHGVFSLDDFQFLPFLFGSSQLIGHPSLEPNTFPLKEVAANNADKHMFHSAIYFIHQVKTGPFAEHSNQLWNISGVDDWSRVNRGLLKMYSDEVLNKFPIIQHLLFGQEVLVWKMK